MKVIAHFLKNFTFVSNDDSLDWKNYGVQSIINTVVNHKHLGNGSIILCHNGAKNVNDIGITKAYNIDK